MSITAVPLALARFQYRLARRPLVLIEQQLAARLTPEAPARLMYERSLGMLDATAGRLFGDSELSERGAALAKRSDARARAAELDGEATGIRKNADAKLKSTREQATEERKQAREQTEQEVKEARDAAEERKRSAAQSAEKHTAEAKRRANETAEKRVQAAESAKSDAESRIQAVEKSSTKRAEGKLEDAQAARSEAASKRATANRVEELADAEKRERQTARKANSNGS